MGTSDLYAARHTSADGWGTPVAQEGTDEIATSPDLAMNEVGNAVLAWQQFEAAAGTRILVRWYESGR
ncbi:hypothetical protein GmRootV35_53350 [Variovorax sp. V35]